MHISIHAPNVSSLKGAALYHFEFFIAKAEEPLQLHDFKLFANELFINFSPYNMIANANNWS